MRAMARMLRNVGLGLVAALAVYYGVRALVIALASPATRVRWVVEDMLEGFNRARAAPVLEGIAKDFVDATAALTREDIHKVLVYLYLNETDEQGGFLWSATLVPDSLAVEVAEDEQSADTRLAVQFHLRRGAQSELVWDAQFRGTVSRTDDGWRWTRLALANHGDRRR